MLLTEYRPFKVDKQLVEASIKRNKPLMVSGVLQRANAKNHNERVYPKDILAREMRAYVEGPVKEKRALGELDHPESSVINLQNVSHNVTKCWWDGDDVMGDIEILPTPAGNILKALFGSGITFDFVSTPSTQGAFMFPEGRALQEGKNQLPEYKYTNINNIIRDIICDNTGMCEC